VRETRYHIAQVNIARALAPLTDPLMKGFVDQLDYINSVADRSPGFVWRLKADDGNATSIRAFDDPLMIVNMSVWRSVEALFGYVFRSDHLKPMRERRNWFSKLDRPHSALWWIRAGHRPDVEEACYRLDLLRERGPTPAAFTFAALFDQEGRPVKRVAEMDRGCAS
jgi:hypothetical protein